jgi:hypothetical protein
MVGGECVSIEAQRYAATIRRHDGFFLRFELGVGGLFGSRTEIDDEVRFEGDISGLSQVGAFMLGGTVAPGLVLGGGGWGVNAPATSYDGDISISGWNVTDRVAENQQVDVGLASLSIIAPFVAWYPDPTFGLHGELAVGLALATIGDYDDYRGEYDHHVSDYEGAGWGTVVSAGYDFWVGEQWNLGLFGRVSYVGIGMSGGTNTLSAWSPALGVAATYH